MKKRLTLMGLAMGALMGAGCVEVHHLVKMNHEGSGTLTERIRVLPRAIRMMEGMKARGGASESSFAILSEGSLKKRMEAFGEVTLKSKQSRTLPDGTLELEMVFEFQDLNKVRLWMAPTLACTDPKQQGRLGMRYSRIVSGSGREPKYYKVDQLSIEKNRHPGQSKSSSPSIVQDYREVTPMFQDMLRSFRLEVQIKAPDDVEQYEDPSMVIGMPIDGNVVTPYRIHGENVVINGEVIRAFLMGEVGGKSSAWGGDWRPMERSLPDTYTPYGSDDGGMRVRFLKSTEVPKPQ